MRIKNLVFMLMLLAAFVAWTAPAAVWADDGAIELPENENDHPFPDPDDGLSADPQTFDVEVERAPVVEVSPGIRKDADFWSRFLAAYDEMMQRIWEIASPR